MPDGKTPESPPAHGSGGKETTSKATAVHAGHMKLLFENAPVAMAMFDHQMRYLLANRRWLEDFKLTQTDVTGKSQYELFPSLHAGWRHVYDRALGGQVVRSDRDAVTQDGRPVVYRWEVRPWRHIDTSIGGVMITCEHLYAAPGGKTVTESGREAPLEEGNALWQSGLPLMALDAQGRVLRMSRGISNHLLPKGVSNGETPFWVLFGETMERGPLQQHVLATLRTILSGDREHAVVSVHGDDVKSGAEDQAVPDRWLVSKAPGISAGSEDHIILAVGLAGLETPPPLLASVAPPPAAVIFGDVKDVIAPLAPALAPAPPAPVVAPAPPAPVQLAPNPAVVAADEGVQRRLAEEVARIRVALRSATDSESQSLQREARLRSVLELAPCGLLILDERARPLYCNAHMHLLLGRPLADGGSIEEWLEEGCRDEAHREQVLLQWREGIWRKQRTVALSLSSMEGVIKDIEVRPVSLPGGGLLAMWQDVTDTRRSEEMLRSTESKFRTLVHENPLPVLLADRLGAVFDANPAAESLLGYSRAELRRMRMDRWLDTESVAQRAATLRDMLDHGERAAWVTVNVVHRDGDIREVDLRLAIVPDALGQPLFTIHFFQPKEAEHPESLLLDPGEIQSYRESESAAGEEPQAPPPMVMRPVVLLMTDVHGRISAWSAEAKDEFGFEEGEIVGRGLHTLFRPSDATGFYAELSALSAAVPGPAAHWPFYHRDLGRKEGDFSIQSHTQDGALSVSLLKELPGPAIEDAAPQSAKAEPAGAIAKEESAAAPPAKLASAELQRERLMMGESYRRVKNHLQIITSMLSLQVSTLRNDEARDALRSSQNRVRSLASLHQHLYLLASGEMSGFQNFASGLVDHLRECYDLSASRVRLDLKVQDESLPEDWLMPLALSLNEMISNAFKHGYPDGRGGRMEVQLNWDSQKGHLIVNDDGVGMSTDLDDYRGNGLGLKILRVFSGQLGGVVKIHSAPDRGASFHLEFPVTANLPS
ncbi:MAG TPA: PAS domain S-box protein [Verrucomicrobium sp.]|nr:PAS domain S-box protein [Verrucomicrobium sp.]